MPRPYRPSAAKRPKATKRPSVALIEPPLTERPLQVGVWLSANAGGGEMETLAALCRDFLVRVRQVPSEHFVVMALTGPRCLDLIKSLATDRTSVTAVLPADPDSLVGLLGLAISEKELGAALEVTSLYEWPDAAKEVTQPAALQMKWMQDRLLDLSDLVLCASEAEAESLLASGPAKKKGPPVFTSDPSRAAKLSSISLAELRAQSGALALYSAI